MMPDELFQCEASTSVVSSPPSEVLKTLYEKDPNDLEGAAKQVLLPANEVRHIITVVTLKFKSHFLLRTMKDLTLTNRLHYL